MIKKVLVWPLMWLMFGFICISCATTFDTSEQLLASDPPVAEIAVDYSDQVFDTSTDINHMVAHFLYLSEIDSNGATSVRAGDSTVITTPDGKIILVDCGNEISGKQVVESLKRMGVESIDVFIASHMHADHIGGFSSLVENFIVNQVYLNNHVYESSTYNVMMTKIIEKSIPFKILFEGDILRIGTLVDVEVYNPPVDYNFAIAGKTATQMANDGSLCIRFAYKESSFLLAGDMYIGSEERIAKKYAQQLHSGVVKMNHHGDSTSNSTLFVQMVNPKIAVAMNEGILSMVVDLRYKKNGAITYYNCVDGAIKVSTSGNGYYHVQTQLIRELTSIGKPSKDGSYDL